MRIKYITVAAFIMLVMAPIVNGKQSAPIDISDSNIVVRSINVYPEWVFRGTVEIIAEYTDSEIITRGMTLTNDLGIDSLDRVELCQDLSSRFEVDIPIAVALTVLTVNDLCQYISDRIPNDDPEPEPED